MMSHITVFLMMSHSIVCINESLHCVHDEPHYCVPHDEPDHCVHVEPHRCVCVPHDEPLRCVHDEPPLCVHDEPHHCVHDEPHYCVFDEPHHCVPHDEPYTVVFMMSNTTVVLVMSHTTVVLMVNHSSCKQDELHLISCSSLYSVLAIIPLFFSFLFYCFVYVCNHLKTSFSWNGIPLTHKLGARLKSAPV